MQNNLFFIIVIVELIPSFKLFINKVTPALESTLQQSHGRSRRSHTSKKLMLSMSELIPLPACCKISQPLYLHTSSITPYVALALSTTVIHHCGSS